MRSSSSPGASRTACRPPWSRSPLLAGTGGGSFAAHLDRWGPLEVPTDLVAEVARAGLGARDTQSLSTPARMAAVRAAASGSHRHPVVVANGCEGDPVGAGRRALLAQNPHLVLDGVAAACAAVTADRVLLCIDGGQKDLEARLRFAIEERRDRVGLEVLAIPTARVARLEPALVGWLTHHRSLALPARRSSTRIGGRPILVEPVETLAGVAVVARGGACWWRGIGTAGEPGTIVATVTGGVRRPGVREVAAGSRLATVLEAAGTDPYAAVLVGGLSGTWLSAAQAVRVRLSKRDLSPPDAATSWNRALPRSPEREAPEQAGGAMKPPAKTIRMPVSTTS